MLLINLAQVPNQTLTVQAAGNSYDLIIKEANGCMVVSITINGTKILDNIIAVAGTPLIPYRYLENGNFFIDTNGDLPYYTEFGVTQYLYFLTQDEISTLRAGV